MLFHEVNLLLLYESAIIGLALIHPVWAPALNHKVSGLLFDAVPRMPQRQMFVWWFGARPVTFIVSWYCVTKVTVLDVCSGTVMIPQTVFVTYRTPVVSGIGV